MMLFKLTLFLLIFKVLASTSSALLDCYCTTDDCQAVKLNRCLATHSCYAEYYAVAGQGRVSQIPVRHGCINQANPLLCENRKPKNLGSNPWPVLHCCEENWCNSKVEPSLPDWAQPTTQGNPFTTVPPSESASPTNNTSSTPLYNLQQTFSKELPDSSKDDPLSPLYVAVPVLGACVIFILVIIVIYIIRKQSDLKDYSMFHKYETAGKNKNNQHKKTNPTMEPFINSYGHPPSAAGSETKLLATL